MFLRFLALLGMTFYYLNDIAPNSRCFFIYIKLICIAFLQYIEYFFQITSFYFIEKIKKIGL